MDANGESPTLFHRLRAKEAEQEVITRRPAEARQQAAHPLAEAWGEARTLLGAVRTAPDKREARLRLRSALRRALECVLVLVVPCGRTRIAAVQFWFVGGTHRGYLIISTPPHSNGKVTRPGHTNAPSFADVNPGDALDLRVDEHVAELAAALQDWTPARLER